MHLINTNILIYFYDGCMTVEQKHGVTALLEMSFHISVISKMDDFKGIDIALLNPFVPLS
ncbi:hypothetical protein JXO59_14245 [candidate division KSB1 bacterium]|nr:hypothetical protein [candidate division KSB1 bacterium]